MRRLTMASRARRDIAPISSMLVVLIPLAICTLVLAGATRLRAAKDQAKTDSYSDGKPHYVYNVDSDGRKNGEFRELGPDGRLLVSASYVLCWILRVGEMMTVLAISRLDGPSCRFA